MIHPTFPFLDVTPDGRVFNLKRRVWQKQNQNNSGYMVSHFRFNGRKITKPAHRLVLETFIPVSPDGKSEANHKDGNKLNNTIDNLEWCSRSENCFHKHRVLMVQGARTKLNRQQRADIRVEFFKLNGSKTHRSKSLSERFGVSAKTIEAIAYAVAPYSDNRLVA